MKKTILFAGAFIYSAFLSLAQLPELQVRTNSLTATTPIEKAQLAYEKGDYRTAEALLYTELEKGTFKGEDFLLFANALYMDSKPALAKEFYKEYTKTKSNTNVDKQVSRLYTSTTTLPSTAIVTKYPITNPSLNYGRLNTEISGKMMAYNYSCDGSLNGRQEVLENVTDNPYAKVTYFDNGNKAVASLVDNLKNTSKIYYLYQKKGKWKKPVELFSGDKGNYAFPYFDLDNNALYFSSDKKGGQGGYDVYVSIWNGDNFENPISLGDEINSAGNDINPVMTNDWLYFSSNGHVSKGGYDIYKHRKLSENNTLFLAASEFNTDKNEFSILPMGNSAFYLTRQETESNQLHYIEKEAVTTTLSGNVIDEEGKPVVNAYVLINAAGLNDFVISDSEGKYKYTTSADLESVSGLVLAKGYEEIHFDTKNGERAAVQLIKIKPVEIIKEVVRTVPSNSYSTTNLSDSNIVSSSTITTTTVEQKVEDVIISEEVNVNESASSRPDRGLYYIVIGSTYDYAQAYDFWNKWLPEYNGAEILEYDNGLYRIAIYAGTTEQQATDTYNEARKKKKDIWILRPKNN